MADLASYKGDFVFGLDIGTRSVVGVVGYQERNTFNVVAMADKEHETRAMLDGQIHDIYKVGDTIRAVKLELEKQLDFKLKDVCIAAAGRVLKTVNASAEYEFEEETRIEAEHIYSLNLLAVEKAHTQINSASEDIKYYCVGNTPVKYRLNSFEITNLEGHKANKIAVDLIATFLPEEVVDGLYQAVEYAGLNVASLTLEPIAAMNIAIPEQYRLLNIGLIDVGAGTSDICLTKDGSIIAYGMIPLAGDELTEVIAKTYLVDFNTAEQIKIQAGANKDGEVEFKDIMGLPMKVAASDVCKTVSDTIDAMARDTADKIKELNGGKSVNAVFVVGGGGKMPGYTESVAGQLGIAKERVAVRGEEVLTTVNFMVDSFKKDSLYVTPVGICTNYYLQKNRFVFVNVNKERIKMYDNNRLTVVDAIMQIGYPNELLFPRRGRELEFTVNNKARLVRGTAGEGAVIKLNGKTANLNAAIEQNDVIEVMESTVGEPAKMTIGQLEEFKSTLTFNVNGKNILCPRFAYVNDELQSQYYEIQSGDRVLMENFYTVEQLFAFLDYDMKDYDVWVNNNPADAETRVYENFTVKIEEKVFDEKVFDEKVFEENNFQENNFQENSFEENENYEEKKYENKVFGENRNFEENGANKAPEVADNAVRESSNEKKDIYVMINGTPVKLTGKNKYVLVDIFDFYGFDLSKPQGKGVVLKQNGNSGEYMAPLNDGDIIELYWDK